MCGAGSEKIENKNVRRGGRRTYVKALFSDQACKGEAAKKPHSPPLPLEWSEVDSGVVPLSSGSQPKHAKRRKEKGGTRPSVPFLSCTASDRPVSLSTNSMAQQ
jgi:hypothetical protein